jgi:hypothetical protein
MSTTAGTWIDAGVTAPPKDESSHLRLARMDDLGRSSGRIGGKAHEDDSAKELKKAVKAMGKPSKKEEKKINKITKHLSKNEKV